MSHGALYSGLLYILVYVGAIVVLIIFVVQLTNTSLSQDHSDHAHGLLPMVQIALLLLGLIVMMTVAVNLARTELLLAVSTFNVSSSVDSDSHHALLSELTTYVDSSVQGSSLTTLASSIFNEYAYVLVLSVHAIILAVIGPIKLALAPSA